MIDYFASKIIQSITNIPMKTAYLSDNNTQFDKLFKNYQQAKEEYLKLTNGLMPDMYFMFDTRFSLSTAMNISFGKSIKSGSAKSCYSRLIKLSDLWLTYETMLHMVKDQGFFADKNAKATAISEVQANKIFELNDILSSSNSQLAQKCFANSRKADKVKAYISFLAKDNTPSQVAILNRALFSFKSGNNLGIQEFTSFIFAIHNAFAKNGDTAISRVQNLELVKSLFEVLFDYLLLSTIKIATKLIENKTQELTN